MHLQFTHFVICSCLLFELNELQVRVYEKIQDCMRLLLQTLVSYFLGGGRKHFSMVR